MGLRAAEDTESRFTAFVDGLVSVIGHADRAGPLRDYWALSEFSPMSLKRANCIS
jgi:hypothetical protein